MQKRKLWKFIKIRFWLKFVVLCIDFIYEVYCQTVNYLVTNTHLCHNCLITTSEGSLQKNVCVLADKAFFHSIISVLVPGISYRSGYSLY